MALTNLESVESMVQSNLTETIQPLDTLPEVDSEQLGAPESMTNTMFEDDESMNFLMNKIGLEVQRNGGQ